MASRGNSVLHHERPVITSRTKRLIVRGVERRCGQTAFKGKDRRRANYDRRKLAEPSATKPPMSDFRMSDFSMSDIRRQPRHMPGYVADVAAQTGAYRRASGLEATGRYIANTKHRTDVLLRGLTVDSEIS